MLRNLFLIITLTAGSIFTSALASMPAEGNAIPRDSILFAVIGCLLIAISQFGRSVSAPKRNASAALLLSILLPAAGFAQDSVSDWNPVIRLEPGTRLHLIHDGLRQSSGSFVSATKEAVTIRTATGNEEVIAKRDITRISSTEMTRKKRAVIGMAIGAAVATAAMAIGAKTGDIDVTHAILLGGAAVAGAGTGAAIGAASGGPRTIYRASVDGARAMRQK